MFESDVKMADWTSSSLFGCAGVISCLFHLGKGVLIGRGPLDISSALGPLRMPPNIGNRKRLLAEQCSRSGLSVLVLVPARLPFSGSGALDYGKGESKEAVDSKDVETEFVVVVSVVCTDGGLFKCHYPLSGEPVHPRLSSKWKHLVIRLES